MKSALTDCRVSGRAWLRPAGSDQFQAGATLVELMIAVTILAMLLVMGMPSYSSWLQNSQLRTATQAVENGLQLARAEAVRRNTRVAFTVTGNDWSIDVVAPATNIQRRSGADGTPNAVITAAQNVITFNALGRVLPSAVATINVANPTGGACQLAGGPMRCLSVTVSPGGQIRMCDPALPATNVQSC